MKMVHILEICSQMIFSMDCPDFSVCGCKWGLIKPIQLHDHHHVVPLEPVHLLHILIALPQNMLKPIWSQNKSNSEYTLKYYGWKPRPPRLIWGTKNVLFDSLGDALLTQEIVRCKARQSICMTFLDREEFPYVKSSQYSGTSSLIMSCCLQEEKTWVENQEDIFKEVSSLLEVPIKPRRRPLLTMGWRLGCWRRKLSGPAEELVFMCDETPLKF